MWTINSVLSITTRFIAIFVIFVMNSQEMLAQQAESAFANITPNSVVAGENTQSFNYIVDFTDGTADSIAIMNPFIFQDIYVYNALVNGEEQVILNSQSRPQNIGQISWWYDTEINVLILLSDSSAIVDSLDFSFIMSIPEIVSTNNNFTCTFDDAQDFSPPVEATEIDWTVDVLPGPITAIYIEDASGGFGNEVEDISITTDETIDLYAITRDNYGNYIGGIASDWSVTNFIGTVNPNSDSESTVFDATTIGAGAIVAETPDFIDQTGVITVTGGALNYLLIRDGANGGGDEVGAVEMTTDESLVLYSAGYDADDNYLGDTLVTWSTTGSLSDEDMSDQNAETIMYEPSEAGQLGYILAVWSEEVFDSTGIISVLSPPVIEYIPGSLVPSTVTINKDASFVVQVVNTGNVDVTLDTTCAFWFTDGEDTVLTKLLDDVFVEAVGEEVTLNFEQVTIPESMSGGMYSPFLTIHGTDSDGNEFSQGSILTEPAGLEIAVISIGKVFASDSLVWQGLDSISLNITVTNHSQSVATNIEASPTFGQYSGQYSTTRLDTINQILTGEQVVLYFLVSIDSNATPGNIVIDASVSAIVNGVEVNDGEANIDDSWEVLSLPNVSFISGSFTPRSVTQGQSISISLAIRNEGTMSVGLSENSHLVLASEVDSLVIYLVEETIVSGSTPYVYLNFETVQVDSSFQAGAIYPRLTLEGNQQNGDNFSQALIIQDTTFIVHTPVELSLSGESINPDTVFSGSAVAFSIFVLNSGTAEAILSTHNSKVTFTDGVYDYDAEVVGDLTIPGDTTRHIVFDEVEIPSGMTSGAYTLVYTLMGEDENEVPFSFIDSSGYEALLIMVPPILEITGQLQPSALFASDTANFSLYLTNLGEAEVLLDTTTILRLGEGTDTLVTHLSDTVYLHGEEENREISFDEIIVPVISPGVYPMYLDMRGKDQLGNDYVLTKTAGMFAVQDYIGPVIENVRFVDGGYNGVPDGVINDDLVLVKFESPLNHNILRGLDARRYFLLLPDTDTFGSEDSSVVVAPVETGYSGTDSDSILFIRLGDEAILSSSSGTNRSQTGSTGPSETILKAQGSPSLVMINPNIELGLLAYQNGRDAGFPANESNLLGQFDEIDETSEYGIFSKYALVVDDGIPPFVLNFYPSNLSWTSNSVISRITPVKAFVSGRNYLFRSDMETYLNTLFGGDTDSTQKYLDNISGLHNRLDNMLSSPDSADSRQFIDTLRYYYRSLPLEGDDLMVNPLAQMYTNVIDTVYFTYSSSNTEPEEFVQPMGTDLEFDNRFDEEELSAELDPDYNLVITNSNPLSDSVYVWFEINTVISKHTYVNSFAVNDEGADRSTGGFLVRTAPNPFTKSDNVVIEYVLPSDVSGHSLELMIIDSAGRLVRKWRDNSLVSSAGVHRVTGGWDLSNGDGIRVGQGLYLLCLQIDSNMKATWVMAGK